MNVTIINGDFEISDEEKASIEGRIRLALGRYSTKIARVSVKLSQTSAPDEAHNICRLEVLLRPTRKIVVEDKDTDLQAAVDRAAVQMARSVERKLRRERALNGYR